MGGTDWITEHWKGIREARARERDVLRAQGRVVVSSEMHFPAGTSFAYRRADLGSFTTDELRAEMQRRGVDLVG